MSPSVIIELLDGASTQNKLLIHLTALSSERACVWFIVRFDQTATPVISQHLDLSLKTWHKRLQVICIPSTNARLWIFIHTLCDHCHTDVIGYIDRFLCVK